MPYVPTKADSWERTSHKPEKMNKTKSNFLILKNNLRKSGPGASDASENPVRYVLLVTTKSLRRTGDSEGRRCRRGRAETPGEERQNALEKTYQIKITIHDARTIPDRNVRNVRRSSSMAAS